MGRWSQRRHCGSSGELPVVNNLAHMIAATPIATDQILITYSQAINPAGLSAADFITVPGGFVPILVTGSGDEFLQATFGDAIADETDVQYSGTTPGFLTPDAVAIT